MSDSDFQQIVNQAWGRFKRGDVSRFGDAVAMLDLGRRVGWQGIRLVYGPGRYAAAQRVLDVRFLEVLPDLTCESKRLAGIRLADAWSSFWDAAKSGRIGRGKSRQIRA